MESRETAARGTEGGGGGGRRAGSYKERIEYKEKRDKREPYRAMVYIYIYIGVPPCGSIDREIST